MQLSLVRRSVLISLYSTTNLWILCTVHGKYNGYTTFRDSAEPSTQRHRTIRVIGAKPSGQVGSVMSRLATLIHPPCVCGNLSSESISQYTLKGSSLLHFCLIKYSPDPLKHGTSLQDSIGFNCRPGFSQLISCLRLEIRLFKSAQVWRHLHHGWSHSNVCWSPFDKQPWQKTII